jgi:hypothetical protein
MHQSKIRTDTPRDSITSPVCRALWRTAALQREWLAREGRFHGNAATNCGGKMALGFGDIAE